MSLRIESLLVLLVLLLPACVTTGSNVGDQAITSQIEVEKSNKSEVIGLLGLPERVSYEKPGGETWEYLQITTVPQLPNYVPLIRAYAGGYANHAQELLVTFNQAGVVTGLGRRRAAVPGPVPY